MLKTRHEYAQAGSLGHAYYSKISLSSTGWHYPSLKKLSHMTPHLLSEYLMRCRKMNLWEKNYASGLSFRNSVSKKWKPKIPSPYRLLCWNKPSLETVYSKIIVYCLLWVFLSEFLHSHEFLETSAATSRHETPPL